MRAWIAATLSLIALWGCKETPSPNTRGRKSPAPTSRPSLRARHARKPPARARRPRLPSKIRVIAVGDIMVHGSQLRSAYVPSCKCYRWDKPFRWIKPELQRADIAIGNLETTFPGKKAGYGGFPNFAVPDSLGESLKRAGFDALTLANNHIYDKGLPGLIRTVQTVRRLGMAPVGAYASKEESRSSRFAMFDKKGIKLALFSYTSHINHPRNAYRRLRFDKQKKWPRQLVNFDDKDAIKRDLAMARKRGAEVIVVFHHFGPEYKHAPSKRQREITLATWRAGADVVLGAHPHVVQPVEAARVKDQFGLTKPRLVAYSLGNLISNIRRRSTSGGIALAFEFEKRYDAKGKSHVQLKRPEVLPLWVYRPRRKVSWSKKSHYDFQVFWLKEFQKKGGKAPKMDRGSKRRALQFGTHTWGLLKAGMSGVKKLFP